MFSHGLRVFFILLEVVLLFNLLIVVHELGHFLAARWRGLYIEKFGVWFGKPLWKKTINGVQYSLGSIPFGGFVALPQLAPMDLIEGKAEELPDDLGTFDVVTIGRALHRMDRDAMSARLERLVAPNGRIIVCSSYPAADGRNPWLDEYNKARRFWSAASLWSESGSGARTHRDLAAFFRGTRFHVADVIKLKTSHEISVRDLARRVLTFSSSSPDVLGERVEAMLRDVQAHLLPLAREGLLTEVVVSAAQVAVR